MTSGPFVLTAMHCFSIAFLDAPTVVMYWNYQRPACGSGTATRSDGQSGAVWRADYEPSDMVLLELDDKPNPAHNVYFAGWDRGSGIPASAVTIHHPRTHYKSISVENDELTVTHHREDESASNGKYFRVADWDRGSTERGSSGSPLFDVNKRVVGQLSGGPASCSNDEADWYGRLASAWTGGGWSATRLSDWLDPDDTGATAIDGVNPNRPPEAEGTLDHLSVQVADGAQTVNVEDAFLDRDGDELTYAARSLDGSVATASANESSVTVVPLSGGTATVEVTATDEKGSNRSALQRFTVTVENRAPVAEGSLPALMRRVAHGAATVEVADAFRDPDRDRLTYGASSSAESVAQVSAEDSTVTVTPIRLAHLTELRSGLAAAYAAAGRPAPVYTDPARSVGRSVITAAQVMELRAAVLALEPRPPGALTRRPAPASGSRPRAR